VPKFSSRIINGIGIEVHGPSHFEAKASYSDKVSMGLGQLWDSSV
jgi:hypothetical protein